MQIKGFITWVGEKTTGTSRSGNQWAKRPFEVTYEQSAYPKAVVFDCFDTNIIDRLATGLEVEVKFDITSREYNGRRYNDVRIWKDGLHAVGSAPALQSAPAPQPTAQQESAELPF